jgi:hypothetical protein
MPHQSIVQPGQKYESGPEEKYQADIRRIFTKN